MAQDCFILCFLPRASSFSGSLPSAGNTHPAPGFLMPTKAVGDVQRTLLHCCQLSLLTNPVNKKEMTRALIPGRGSRGRGRQGRDRAVMALALSHPRCAGSHGNSKTQQHQDKSSDGVLGHGQPTPNCCCATQSSSERAPEPLFSQIQQLTCPLPRDQGSAHPCRPQAQLIPGFGEASRLSHSADMEMETRPDGH